MSTMNDNDKSIKSGCNVLSQATKSPELKTLEYP